MLDNPDAGLLNPGIGFACPSTGKATLFGESQTGLPDDHSEWEPPEPMPNSEVKPLSADGSVGSPHVRVGHRQAPKYKRPPSRQCRGFFVFRTRCPSFPTKAHVTADAPKVPGGGAEGVAQRWRAPLAT